TANATDSYGTRPGSINDLSQPFITTNTLSTADGGKISFLETNYHNIQVRNPFESTTGQGGFVTLRQPLLKNFWIDATRMNIWVSKKRLQMSELGLRFQILNIVTAVQMAYYDLIF